MELLETLGAIQYPKDGALLNYISLNKQNGIINGCLITKAGNSIVISAGMLVIQGYRVKFQNAEELLKEATIKTLPNGSYKLFIRIIASSGDASAEIKYTLATAPLIAVQVQLQDGSFDLQLCSFTVSSGGLASVKSSLSYVNLNKSTTGQVNLGVNRIFIPSPKLSIFSTSAKKNGYLLLDNIEEYRELANAGYSVTLKLYRYFNQCKMDYKSPKTGTKKRYKKSGYIAPKMPLGWNPKNSFDLVVNIDRLKKVNFVNTSNDTWCKTNIIEGLEKFCTVMFYEDKNIVDSSQEEHCYIKSKITATSNPYFIRTTRSKRKKHSSKSIWPTSNSLPIHKHNFFRFCYVAQLKTTNGVVIATSDKSNDVLIRPNLKFNNPTKEREVVDLFDIKII